MRLKVAVRRHRVGRRDDRAEHERRRPASGRRSARGRRPRPRPSWPAPAPSARNGQRPQLGAQLARRGVEARRGQQRRQEDEEHDLGLELDLRQARAPRRPRARRARARSGTGRAATRRPARARPPRAAAGTGTRGRPRPRRVYDRAVPASLDPPLGPDDHVRGAADAPYELVMYGDFECPYCAAAQSILARVRTRLGDELRFVFRHLPLEAVHPHARHAAEAAEAAAAQGAFWEMHDALYAARGRLDGRATSSRTRAGSGSTPTASRRELAAGAHARARGARRRAPPQALGLSSHARPSSSTASRTRTPTTPARSSRRCAAAASARTSASTCTPPRNTTADGVQVGDQHDDGGEPAEDRVVVGDVAQVEAEAERHQQPAGHDQHASRT